MLAKVARIALLIISIFVLAMVLPDFYWKVFDVRIDRPFGLYSPVIDDYIVFRSSPEGLHFYDSQGNTYSREEYDRLLPLFNVRQLIYEGEFPDSLRGVAVEMDSVRLHNIRFMIQPRMADQEEIPVYPLFESQSGRVRLEWPTDFFRIGDKMEFLNTANNSINRKLTDTFASALSIENFVFPARLIAGNPTTRKPFDEGYFIVDSENKIFHVKMVQGEPFVRETGISQDLHIKNIFVWEMNLREFYGVLVAENSECFLISYDNYRLIRLPISGYQFAENQLRFYGSFFFRNLICFSDTSLLIVTTDRDYQVVDRYQENWKDRYDFLAGHVAEYIFPFILKLKSSDSGYIGFFIHPPSERSLPGILLLIIVVVIFFRYRKYSIKQNWMDILIIVLTGIYGFLTIIFFQPLHKKF